MKRVLVILSLTLLVGCSATGPKFTSNSLPADDSVIYVYRPSHIANSAGYPKIKIDGQEIGPLKNGGYLPIVTSPGKHMIEQVHSLFWVLRAEPVDVNVEANKKYYIRLDTSASVTPAGVDLVLITRYISFKEVEESVGLSEINTLNQSN